MRHPVATENIIGEIGNEKIVKRVLRGEMGKFFDKNPIKTYVGKPPLDLA